MSGLLSVLGLLGLALALLGLVKGSLRSLGLRTRTQCGKAAVAAFVVVAVGGSLAPDTEPARDRAVPDPARAGSPSAPASAPAPAQDARPAPAAATAAPPPPVVVTPRPARSRSAAPLLLMASGGDGDSWRDTSGVEYRMGLVNAPETDECGGSAATAYRKRALAAGFRAQAYATDRYGRKVSVVLAANGVNLNVAMARDGVADDTYLEQFRHENPALAAQLDVAFREARGARRGIWRTCTGQPAPAAGGGGGAQAPQPAAGGRCHPDYSTCIPVVGDGSGRGAANDLDCGQIDSAVQLREIGRDPYRLDGSDQDGVGCE